MSDYNLGTASGRIEVDGRGAALGFKVARSAAAGFFSVIDAKIASVQQLGRRMAVVGTAGTAMFGVAIKQAADFQQAMSGVQAITGSTGEEFDALKAKALDLGAKTVFSAMDAANAIEELAKAGIPVADILNGAADAAVALAAAGGISIPEAATVAANAMNQFSLAGKDVGKIADVLAGVANTSAADVSSLGQSLAQSGAVANLAGLSFRDTAIALGEMADAGIQGSDAGTSVKTMLNNLIPVTKKQIEKFKELGLLTVSLTGAQKAVAKVTGGAIPKSYGEAQKALAKYVQEQGNGDVGTIKNATAVQALMMQYGGLHNAFFDAKGDIKDLEGLQGTLARALKGMTKQQKLSTLETLFGADAMRASAILSLEGAKGYRDFSDAVSKTKAADVAKTRLNNLAGAVESFKGSLQTAQITIGTIFLPMVTKLVQGITMLLNFFNGLPKPIQIAIGVFAAIASAGLLVVGMLLAMAPAILGMIANFFLMRSLGFVFTFFRTLVAEAAAGTLGLNSISAAARVAGSSFLTLGKRGVLAGKLLLIFTRAIYAIGVAMKFAMTNPYVLAFIALAAVGVLLYKKWAPFRELVDSIARVMVTGFKAAWNALRPLLVEGLAKLKEFGSWIASTLGPIIENFAGRILNTLVQQWAKIQRAIDANLMPALRELSDEFNGSIVPAFHSLMGVVGPVASAIGSKLAPVLAAVGQAVEFVARMLITKLAPILIKIYSTYLIFLIKEFGNLLVGVIKVITGIINVITGFIKIFKGIFTGDWSLVLEGAQQVLKGWFTVLTAMFLAGLKLPLKLLGQFLSSLKDMIVKGFQNLFGGGGGDSGPLTPLVDFVKTGLSTIVGLFKAFFAVLAAPFVAFWKVFGGVITAAFKLWVAIVRLGWIIIKGLFLLWLIFIWNVVKTYFNLIAAIIRTALAIMMGIIRAFLRGVQVVFGPPFRVAAAIVRTAFNIMKNIVSSVLGFIIGIIKGQLAVARAVFSSVWNSLRGIVSKAWDAIKKSISDHINAIVSIVKGLKEKILGPLGDLAGQMFDAGAHLMQLLLDGISSKIDDITSKINSVADKVKKFLPGSPVKTGPLTAWNDGKAGRELMKLLQIGIEKETGRTVRTAAKAAGKVQDAFAKSIDLNSSAVVAMAGAGGTRAVTPMASAAGRKNRVRRRGGKGAGSGRSRLLEGHLTLDESGHAFIRGIAEDVVGDDDGYGDTVGRMG